MQEGATPICHVTFAKNKIEGKGDCGIRKTGWWGCKSLEVIGMNKLTNELVSLLL